VTVDSRPLSPDQFELHRRELTGYCYRVLGSGFEADDAVQETMLRAWKAVDGFEVDQVSVRGSTGSPPTYVST
jgi:DNA-directed RNA polymerase specialized sigma24 family protein